MKKLWRVLIVDDEPSARDRLIDLCENSARVEIAGACEDIAAAREAIADWRIDLVFLDIRMPGGDGFDLLQGLPTHSRPAIVFVTAHAEHAVRAFGEHVVDYLLKPFDDERFAEALERVVEELDQRHERGIGERLEELLAGGRRRAPSDRFDRLVVRSPGRVSFLPAAEVECLVADGNSVRIHTGTEEHRVRSTMGAIERQLDPERFTRIHRSTIVNLERLRQVQVGEHGGYVVVTDRGQKLPVGRAYRDRIQELLQRGGTDEVVSA
jgi:two-component system LytT family response regulator